MRRSGDVTASAIVMLFGSAFILAIGLIVVVAVAIPGPRPHTALFALAAIYGLPGAWGIANGIGILRLRSWARISSIVMSILAVCFLGFLLVGSLLAPFLAKSDPEFANVPVGFIAATTGVALAIPLGIAIWWLVLFTRKRVVAEFTNRGATIPAFFPAESSEEAQPIPVGTGHATQIPLSIRIITVVFLLGVGIAFLSLTYSIRLRMPALLLGRIVEGWPAWALLIALALIQLVACIAVFKKRAWALDVLIACLIFGLANSASLLIAPTRVRFFQEIMQRESLPPNVSADLMKNIFGVVFPISIGLGAVLGLVMLYFLFTRRRAFRAACAPRNSGSNPSASGAPNPEIAP